MNPIIKYQKIRFFVVFLLVFAVISVNCIAQDNKLKVEQDMHNKVIVKTPMKIPGVKTEEKGNHSTYIIADQKSYFVVYNKSSHLIHTYSSFMEYIESPNQAWKHISIDRSLLDLYLKKFLSPHFGGKSVKYADTESIGVGFFSDIEGNIKEIMIDYPKEIKLPITAIEKFEDAVTSGELKLVFDKNHRYFKDATWVSLELNLSIEKIRKMTVEE